MFLVFCSLLFSYLILYLLTFLFPPLLSSFVLLSHLSFSHSHLISHHLYFILSDAFCHQINICLWNQQVFLKRDRKVKKLMLYILQNTQKQPTWFFSSVSMPVGLCFCYTTWCLVSKVLWRTWRHRLKVFRDQCREDMCYP